MIKKPKSILALQYAAALTGCITVTGYGTIISWSSPALPFLESSSSHIKITLNQSSWIASLYLIGFIIGFLLNPLIVDRLNRKWTLILFAIPQIISWLMIIFAKSHITLYCARLIGGAGYGGGLCAMTVYMTEIGNKNNRGIFLILIRLSMGLGFLITMFLGAYFTYQQMNFVLLMLPISFVVIFIFMPDSSYFLKMNKLIIEGEKLHSRVEDVVEGQLTFVEELKLNGEEMKVNGEEMKVNGVERRLKSEEIRLIGEERKLNGEERGINGEERRINGEERRINGEERRLIGEERKLNGEERRINGEERRLIAEERKLNGEERGINGEERRMRGEERRINGVERSINGEERRQIGEERKLNGEERRLNCEKKGLNTERLSSEERRISSEERRLNSEERELNSEERLTSEERRANNRKLKVNKETKLSEETKLNETKLNATNLNTDSNFLPSKINNPEKKNPKFKKKAANFSLKETNLWQLFKNSTNRKALIIVVTTGLLNILAGQAALGAFGQQILSYKSTPMDPKKAMILLSALNAFACLVSTQIIENIKRRNILIFSGLISSISLIIIGIYFYLEENILNYPQLGWIPIIFMSIFDLLLSTGPSNIFYIYQGEFFANEVKSIAVTVVKFVYIVFGFLTVYYFQKVEKNAGMHWIFWIFGTCCGLGTISVYLMAPESRGKPLEEIQENLKRRSLFYRIHDCFKRKTSISF